MKRIGTIWSAVLLAAMVFTTGCEKTSPKPQPVITETSTSSRPVVIIETSMGVIEAELWADTAPLTVKNFLAYADAKHWDPGFVLRIAQDGSPVLSLDKLSR